MKYSAKILFLFVLSSSLMMCAGPTKKTAEGIAVGQRYGNQNRADD